MTQPLAITPGEPGGIGPDIVLQWATQGIDIPVIIIASLELMRARAQQLNLAVDCIEIDRAALKNFQHQPGTLAVLNTELYAPVKAGELNKANGQYVIDTLDTAIELAMNADISGLVTGPVHKAVINDSGIAFTGHTEYLRDCSQTEEVVMMLATSGLRVALVTTHLPLKDVSAAITGDKIKRVTRILHNALKQDFGCPHPSILVTGLNPHAGENGHLGNEEIDTIIPALAELTAQGIATQGPLPADTLFQPHYLDNADAVLAMYHDQGLPVLKYKGFGNAVNITLGLPFIRSSVDHGTALDLAATGKANTGSLAVAIKTAWDMATQRELHNA